MLPRYVFHLAEASNWPLIQRHGLLSAESILKLAGISAAKRRPILRNQRLDNLQLPGGFEIRHQRPMSPDGLRRCLIGLEPADWYALLNRRVFFWLDPDRLNRMRRACGPGPQIVLTIDTAALLEAHGARASLMPINSGNARRRPARRAEGSFVTYADWRTSGWASEAACVGGLCRSRSHRPVELTILHAVPDVMRFVVSTHALGANDSFTPPGAP